MQVLENGDYKLDDGSIVSKSDIAKLYKSASSSNIRKESEKQELEEGQCSGKVQLND